MKTFNKLIIFMVLCFSAVYSLAQEEEFSEFTSTLKLLVDGSILHTNQKNQNLLHLAVGARNMEVVQWLVDEAPSLLKGRDANGDTPFLYSCITANMEIADFLLSFEEVVDVNESNNDKVTCLHYLAFGLHLEEISFMVSKGADSSLVDKDGDTPAHILLMKLQAVDWPLDPEDIEAALDSLQKSI